METRTCRFCAEEIQAAAVVCKHCGNLVVEADIETLARTWGEYAEAKRRVLWEGLSVERKLALKTTIDYLTRHATPPAPEAPAPAVQVVQAPAKKKDHSLLWAILIVFVGLPVLGSLFLTSDESRSPGSTPERRTAAAPQRPAPPAAKSVDTGRAVDSVYEHNIARATTSQSLSNSDLAWHALNTYGWDCEQVVSRGPAHVGYFTVTCSSGKVLRVYPRSGQHPRITNEYGGYD